ncbi:MAG TPA: C1 family peptidase [Thermoleophilia bacterium]|nr:C1 family peptidase [Thermoleophilia bacterium]
MDRQTATKGTDARPRTATRANTGGNGRAPRSRPGAGSARPVRPQGLSPDQIERFDRAFAADPKNILALNAVTGGKLQEVARSREAVIRAERTFSHVVKTGQITDQKHSGRCWMFAGLNVFRVETMKRLNVEQFEFSQNYLMFYDKLEKANYFLGTVIKTADEPSDGRLIAFLLEDPIQDGGQWDMFADLVRKYGVVPKSVMPESESSSSSMAMNAAVRAKLREYAAALRRCHGEGESDAGLRERKAEMLETIYRMLAIALGRPPREFLWQWRDKDDGFHRDGTISPHQFYERYVGFDLDAFVSLINCPTPDKPFARLYTVQYLGNVEGGEPIRYLNVDMDTFKRAAVEQLKEGVPVWFGCDVGKMLERDLGILDRELYDYELVFGTEFTADKAERVEYGHSVMTHAMVLTGVDLDDEGRPTRWRVENSWGEKYGDKGFFVMSDRWFDEYMFEVVVEKKYLPAELLPVLETEPTVLPPWDPMGSLARSR